MRRRHSLLYETPQIPIKKRKYQSLGGNNETILTNNTFVHESSCSPTSSKAAMFTPMALAECLANFKAAVGSLRNLPQSVQLELQGLESANMTLDEFIQKREEIRMQLPDPSIFDMKTELNVNGACIAGAKLLCDKKPLTRNMAKRLEVESGITKSNVLYQPLSSFSIEEVKQQFETRQAEIAEQFADFQSQMNWKMNLLDGVEKKNKEVLSMSEGCAKRTRSSKEDVENFKKRRLTAQDLKTPKNRGRVDPLDRNLIMQNYALEVASEVVGSNQRQQMRNRLTVSQLDLHKLDSN